MEKEKKFVLRSDSVNEILTTPPKWLFRWGISIIFFAILLSLFLSYIIKYPEKVSASIKIDNSVFVKSNTNGIISHLMVKDSQVVKVNQHLGILKNSANHADVLKLEISINQLLDKLIHTDSLEFLKFSGNLRLGDIRASYLLFVKSYIDLSEFSEMKMGEVAPQDIVSNKTDKKSLYLKIKYFEQYNILKENLIKRIEDLGNQIYLWKKNYLLISPTNGIVCFSGKLINHKVKTNDTLFSVFPGPMQPVVVKLFLPSSTLDKLKKNQAVNIRLDDYPFFKYGYIEGVVRGKINSQEGKYYVDVLLPYGLRTSNNKDIVSNRKINGIAEVITGYFSVFDRITGRVL